MAQHSEKGRVGVLFDLDGTLWDATATTAGAWQEVLKRHPEAKSALPLTRETVQTYMGLTNEELATLLFPTLPFGEAFALINESCAIENARLPVAGGELYLGVEKMLDELIEKGYRLFIVSNCQDGYIEAFLEAHHMKNRFADWECSGRTGQSKGENIRAVLKRNGITKAIYVGDTVSDGEGAREAQIPFVYCRYGFGEAFGRGRAESYDAAVSSPAELPHPIAEML